MLHKQFHDSKIFGSEIGGDFFDEKSVGVGVKSEGTSFKNGAAIEILATQNGANASFEFIHGKRFGEIIISTSFQASDAFWN